MRTPPRNGATSIQEAEEPEGNLVAEADFDVVVGDVALRNVLDLVEGLALASDFEQPFAVDEEIAIECPYSFVLP